MRVFITGGTGLIGRHLASNLVRRGDSVTVLTRSRDAARPLLPDPVSLLQGDPTTPGPWRQHLSHHDAVVNLAGEPIFAHRWTKPQKEKIRSTRISATHNVVEAIRASNPTPASLVNASAIGYYGPRDDETLSEDAPPGADFLAELSVQWEAEARKASDVGIRTVLLRTGVVLAPNGGALKQMLLPFRLHVGGPIGSGRQWISWIHLDDLVDVILFALDNPALKGPLNATAPNPVTNRDFARTLARTLGRASWLPVPKLALRIALGEVANILARGQRILPAKLRQTGFHFRFPALPEALNDLLHA